MGTNYYIGSDHIGKRSAAGLWCWDCDETLCRGGRSQIHEATDEWHSRCPWCGGAQATPEPLDQSASGRELGFNKQPPQQKTGVASTSSFIWAMPVGWFKKQVGLGLQITDEYDRKYTPEEFEAMLGECRNQRFTSIGKEFS